MRRLLLLIFTYSIVCTVFSQNQPPVAVDDYIIIDTTLYGDTVKINVLANDFDREGKKFRIKEVYFPDGTYCQDFTDSTILFAHLGNYPAIPETYYTYTICNTTDTNNISNFAKLTVNTVLGPNSPVALNDTVTGIPGYYVYFNPLANDYHPDGDSLSITQIGGAEQVSDSIYRVFIDDTDYHTLEQGYHELFYFVRDTNPVYSYDIGLIKINIDHNDNYFDSLNINNVNARFYCFGNHFWDKGQIFGNNSRFFVPNGSTTSTISANTLWIGGVDQNDSLHLAGEIYRQVGRDYWHGPVSYVYDSLYDIQWFNIWKLNKVEIEYHKNHWWENNYTSIEDIESWPGNGDTLAGQSLKLAPFYDNNQNDLYEPYLGDYPLIKGDQALFFIFNDVRDDHSESSGSPLGIEVHAMAYAFDEPGDSAIWNTIFLHYDIINRSDTAYTDTYMGIFSDINIGYAWDDFLQCDVQRGAYFNYNGVEVDGGGEPESYGEHPPAMAVVLLGGAYMESDGIDNPKYNILGQQICDYSINGLNFGDTIVDNERLGMTGFTILGDSYAQGHPAIAPEYYNYMQGIWRDNTNLMYGGWGHINTGAVGPACEFYMPGNSDTCNWGTGGLIPNGGFNQNGFYWTEENIGAIPDIRRGLMNSGPFIFNSGDVHQLDLAFIFARDYNGTPWNSVELMKEYIDQIRDKFVNDYEYFSGIENKNYNKPIKLAVYPNPGKNNVSICCPEKTKISNLSIYNMHGKLVENIKPLEDNCIKWNVSHLEPGLYLVRWTDGVQTLTSKFIKK
ncbi:MAG: T9SS type A sorting domain-containing protein [Bacteroidales bacterium]|nr:T9SS type A sorting domain-containing protein [Bacteroidales bacterium]